MKNLVWFKSAVSVAGLAVFCVLAIGSTDSGSGSSSGGSSSSDSGGSSSSHDTTAANEAAKQDLQANNSWVKDVYISSGHMNIGVIRGEKDWTAPMIGSYGCGVLKKHGSSLHWVRFVDI